MADKCKSKRCLGVIYREEFCKRHWNEKLRWGKTKAVGSVVPHHRHIVSFVRNVDKETLREKLLIEQDYRCANTGCQADIGRPGSSHLDHDHRCCASGKWCTTCVRGLLCASCNMGLGHFGDNEQRLIGAAKYLETWKATSCFVGYGTSWTRGSRGS